MLRKTPTVSDGFLLETGPNHPGQRMWVDETSMFGMTGQRERAEVFKTLEEAHARRKAYSGSYGLQVVPSN